MNRLRAADVIRVQERSTGNLLVGTPRHRTSCKPRWPRGSKHTGSPHVLFMDTSSTCVLPDITPDNSENLEARRHSAEEIARIFQVPAVMAGTNDHSTMTNSETSGRFFVRFRLSAWALRIETAIAHALFAPEADIA